MNGENDAVDFYDGLEQIESGDVIFFKSNNWLARLISWVTKSEYSHVGVAFWVRIDGYLTRRLLLVDAWYRGGVRIINLESLRLMGMDVYTPPSHWANVKNNALRTVGVDTYGWFDFLYVGLRELVLRVFGLQMKPRDFKGKICSEFVAELYDMPETSVSPQKLSEMMQERGCYIKIKLLPADN